MTLKHTDLDDFTIHYLIAAMWSTNDESDVETGGNPIEDNYDLSDFTPEALLSARNDCDAFRKQAGELLNHISDEQAGHDFWLTREGHGAGFWDRGLGKVCNELSDIACTFGEAGLYVGDDNLLHFMNE